MADDDVDRGEPDAVGSCQKSIQAFQVGSLKPRAPSRNGVSKSR